MSSPISAAIAPETTPRITAEMIARSGVVAEPRWSPDGGCLGWVDSRAGVGTLVIAPADGSGPAHIVTSDTPTAPVGAYGGGVWCWAGDDHVAVAAADGRLAVIAASGGPARWLTHEGRAAAPAATADARTLAFVLEDTDACDVAVVPLDGSGSPARVSNADYAWDPAWAPDGSRLAWHEWDLEAMSWDASRIVVARPDGSDAAVVAGGDAIGVGQPRFAPDGRALAYVSDASGWWNVWVAGPDGSGPRAVLAESHEHAGPAWGTGQRSFTWAPDSGTLAINRNEDGFGRLVVAATDGSGVAAISRGWHHALDWGSGGIVCVRSGARTPSTITVVSPDGTGRRGVARGPVGGFEEAGLTEPTPVTWPGDDGATVHGLLTTPAESAFGPGTAPPLLVDVHGGPTGQATAAWRPFDHYFVTRGWAVLAPDYRGSTGHGRAYRTALDGRWGDLDVADTAAGIRAAASEGWCDPNRVAACGGSAGGLTVLLLAAHHGELLRAVVSMYGVTDLLALAASTHRFESRSLDRLVGGLPAETARYRDRSPVTHARAISRPVLVLQGDVDPVVPAEQAQAVVDAIRGGGGTVEHHTYEGEGHGWKQPATIVDVHRRTEAFLRRWVLELP